MIHSSNESSNFKTVSYIHFDDTLQITSMPNHSNGKSQLCKTTKMLNHKCAKSQLCQITKITTMANHQIAISQVCQIYKILIHNLGLRCWVCGR